MPSFFSLPYILGSLVVLGVAQACYYYVYLESPYDYYYRYCNVGCAGMDQNDENFNQCCLPMTSGQTAPAVCQTLSASCAAAGTTCTWGSAVPTSDQPSTSAPPATYTPPAYTPQARDAAPTTSTVWITETTTTPCATTEQPPAPTTSAEECECEDEEGETSEAAVPISSAPGEGNTPDEGFNSDSRKRRRRGFKVRDHCVCPTSTPAASTPAPTTENAATPTTDSGEEECVCPPEGETSEAAVPTSSAPGEGAAAPSGFSGDSRKRGIRARGGECVCPSSTSAPPPPPPPTNTECVCPPEGETSQAAVPTSSAPGEGAAPSEGFTGDSRRRGLMARNGDCVCPTTSAPAPTTSAAAAPTSSPEETPCECPPEGETSNAAVPTSSAPGEGAAPPEGYSGDSRRRRGIMVRDTCVCPTTSMTATPTSSAPGEGDTPSAGYAGDSRKRAIVAPQARDTPPAGYQGNDKRDSAPGENHRRNTNPVQTVTSTTYVTTDDCAQQTSVPPATTANAAVPTTQAPSPSATAPGEGDAPPEGYAGDSRKRKFRRWSDF
ncbi:hypothetical protein I204_01521 [Kwoniella mangroviensis CBS 8886]|nr:hypothetical protein I204_01521 [Kwoniella mangroviensis CBS 8886]